jgi:hypothetical protein
MLEYVDASQFEPWLSYMAQSPDSPAHVITLSACLEEDDNGPRGEGFEAWRDYLYYEIKAPRIILDTLWEMWMYYQHWLQYAEEPSAWSN